MCGITAIYAERPVDPVLLRVVAERRLRHRGPDGIGACALGGATVAHTRLSIIDVAGGGQPMWNESDDVVLVCNGEIYNHLELRARLLPRHRFATRSDSEVVLHLFEERGEDCVHELDGMFAFFVARNPCAFVAARDALGIKPLYYGRDAQGALRFASELKGLLDHCESVTALPPGTSLTETGQVHRWYEPPWRRTVGTRRDVTPQEIVAQLERAVVKRLMSDVPVGVFLSGGLDSSGVAALARRHFAKLQTFSVGLEGAPDLEAARMVARALGTEHHECVYTQRDVESELERIVYHLESYDAALVQSAVPCYFLSRLASRHVKVVLTGEGADELFGGYRHFARLARPEALHRECARLLDGLHAMNLQRVDRMTMAHGLEARVPFLDTDFVDFAMGLDPRLKLRGPGVPEKRLLREAFAQLLPHEIVERSKLEFAQGTGGDRSLKACAERLLGAGELAAAPARHPIDTPTDLEALLCRSIFERHFPLAGARSTVGRWLAAP